MAPPQVPGLNIPMMTGPLQLGFLWGYLLYGVLIVQMYIYHVSFGSKERKWIKFLVYLMFFLETAFTVCSTIAAWSSFGPGWGNIDTILVFDFSWEPLNALNGLIATLVQSFYVWRIWALTRNIWICAFIESISLVQCFFVIYFGVRNAMMGRRIEALIALTDYITVWLVTSAVADVLITITIVVVLRKANRQNNFKQTTDILTRLIRFTVETGSITSAMAIFELILWLTTRDSGYWFFIGFLMIGRIYANTLIASLNSRASFFSGPSKNISMDGSMAVTSTDPAFASTATSAFWNDQPTQGARSGGVSRGEVSLGTYPNPGHIAIRVAETLDIRRDASSHGMAVVTDLNNPNQNELDTKYKGSW